MTNDLTEGTSRLGWMADGDASTPHVATLLRDDGARITLTVPWHRSIGPSPYESWWYPAPRSEGEPAEQVAVPDQLHFYDVNGRVTLVGCRASGYRRIPHGHGQGTVDVEFAVLGGDGDYTQVHGLRSEVPGLARWAGAGGIDHAVTTDQAGRVQSVGLSVSSQPATPLGGPLALQIRPTFETTLESVGYAAIKESVQVQTLDPEPRAWSDHLAAHKLVRDLMSISAWKPAGTKAHWAHRADDPERVMAGNETGTQWVRVQTHEVPQPNPSTLTDDFLFDLNDIGPEGFRRWVDLSIAFQRGLLPLVSLVDTSMHIETRLVQSGIGFEALGYHLAIEEGRSPGAADKETHERRLERVAGELDPTIVPDLGTWPSRSRAAYTSIKHAHRAMPRHIDQLNIEQENELIFRAWVATRVGCNVETLRSRIEHDPMSQPYRVATL